MDIAQIKPRLNVLQRRQIENVHNLALTVLEQTGLRVADPRAADVLCKASGSQSKGDRITIPREITEWAIQAAPSQVALTGRDGQGGFTLNGRDGGQTLFGIGVTNLYYQNILDDQVVPFGRKEMAEATRLGEALGEFDLISTPGVIKDDSAGDPELIGALEMVANTRKPLVLLISELASFENCLEMFDQLIGSEACRNSMVPYFNPITPLILNAETTAKIDLTIARGMPFIFSNYGMSGATAPITPGGTLVVLLAELLGGLVYSQLVKDGTPIILGSLPAAFDMQKMQSFYNPRSMLLNLACGEMMIQYGIPHCGTSGGSFGWGPDLMASSLLWLNHLTSVVGKAGLIPFVGNNFDSLVFSPPTVVYAAEIIRMARDFAAGFSMEPGEIGLNEIIAMGPGANYLESDLTLTKFREPLGESRIWPMLALDEWEQQGQPFALDLLRTRTSDILNNQQAPEDHDELIWAGEQYIQSLSS